MGVIELAVASGLAVLATGRICYCLTDGRRADALFKKRNDREVFYESLKKVPAKERWSYAFFPSRYAKNYIKNHPLPELKQ